MAGGSELLSVRFLVDAEPQAVGDAVARALLFGQPPQQVAAGGWPMLRTDGGLLMPWPISSEWQEATTNIPCMLNPEVVFASGKYINTRSFSLGLRPLGKNDTIGANMKTQGWRVTLEVGYPSNIVTAETTALGAGKRSVVRSFRSTVSSAIITASIANVNCENLPNAQSVDDTGPNSWIEFNVTVQKNGEHTEITRDLLGGAAVIHAAEFPCERTGTGKWDEHAAVRLLRVVTFMMEMETRAWLECTKFKLVEVWRGPRCKVDWVASGSLLTVGSYLFCTGHAGASVNEKRAGPIFDQKLAKRLSTQMPKDLLAAGPQTCKQQEFIEGNVEVESFAGLLNRVCRRANEDADIYRCFVDLGSGPGLAVLTAHLLFPFRKCVGIELQPRVAKTARDMARRYGKSGFTISARSKVDVKGLFVEGDLLRDLDWSDASVIFANAVTWPKDMIKAVGRQALRLQSGAVFLLAARQFPIESDLLEAFDVRGEACLMSFSAEAIFIWAYQRR